jgi:hypothetical protein
MIKQEKQYASFLIEYPIGNIFEHSCNPRTLNNISVNDKPEAPFDVTPVFFSRDVLSKFYNAPHKYSVSDGEVYYKEDGLFLRVDTDMKDYVAVLLVDFAMLDYKEQQYWASFNISPEGKTLSRAAYERWYEGQFAQSVSSDTVLVQVYTKCYHIWEETIGWPLFRENPKDNKSVLYSIHLLSDENNEKEFYEQILNIAKLFNDSLNVKKFPILEGDKNKKGLCRFEAYLSQYALAIPNAIDFLRMIQRLRSTMSAHTSQIEKKVAEYFKIGQYSYGIILNSIFIELAQMLNCLQKVAYIVKERSEWVN